MPGEELDKPKGIIPSGGRLNVGLHNTLGGKDFRYRLEVKAGSVEEAMEENPERPPLAAMVGMTGEQLRAWHEIREKQMKARAVGIMVQATDGD